MRAAAGALPTGDGVKAAVGAPQTGDGVKAAVGALLTGGAGSRMGGDKARLLLAGITLARRGAVLLARVTPEVIQIGGVPITALGIEHHRDLRPDAGPAAGIETALACAGGRPVVVLAVDLPLVPAGLLRAALAMVDAGALIAAPRAMGRWHPLCAAYAPGVLEPLRARLDAEVFGMQAMAEELATPIENDALAAFGSPDHMLLNLNTPDDVGRAEQILRDS